jgi:ABC-type thiamin/hydroxymethylpyrimidine transport system permease subunit
MEEKYKDIHKLKYKNIIIKIIVFIIFLFVFLKWDTIEKYLLTLFK